MNKKMSTFIDIPLSDEKFIKSIFDFSKKYYHLDNSPKELDSFTKIIGIKFQFDSEMKLVKVITKMDTASTLYGDRTINDFSLLREIESYFKKSSNVVSSKLLGDNEVISVPLYNGKVKSALAYKQKINDNVIVDNGEIEYFFMYTEVIFSLHRGKFSHEKTESTVRNAMKEYSRNLPGELCAVDGECPSYYIINK